jgi:mannose-6-phosphate isomerase-like protein (cupin superfamily)
MSILTLLNRRIGEVSVPLWFTLFTTENTEIKESRRTTVKKIGSGKLKLLQLDHEAHAEERHDYPEGLFVARGQAKVIVEGQYVAINTGGMYIVPAGTLHSVETDDKGTVVIFD